MDYTILSQILHYYAWILISILILIMGAIAIFYQRKFQIRTRYYMLIISAILALSVFLHFFIPHYKQQIELTEMLGLLLAAILSLRLYRTMMGAS